MAADSDPVMAKMQQASSLLRQAYDELGSRPADTHRSVARMYLNQARQKLKQAIESERNT